MMMKTRAAAMVATMGAVGMLALSGCSGESKAYVEPDALGEQVANALAAEVGAETPPTVDCGEDKIYPENELVVMCVLSVDGDEAEYDVTVTFDSVEGTEYHFNSVVASEPRA